MLDYQRAHSIDPAGLQNVPKIHGVPPSSSMSNVTPSLWYQMVLGLSVVYR